MHLRSFKQSWNFLGQKLIVKSSKCIKDNKLDKLSTFGCLQKAFKPVVLLDKFLHSLIVSDVLLETVEVKHSSFSVHVYPVSKAHLVMKLENDVEKYCKV